MSLNPCLDAILVEVADPRQIVALSHWSRDPRQSTIAPIAARYPMTWGSAEEVALLRPDLVIADSYSAARLTAFSPRLRMRAVGFEVPNTVEESLAQIDRVAALAGHPERGDALDQRIRAAVARAAPSVGEPRLSALTYEYHGLAAAPGTLMDDLMRRAGLDNAARRYGLRLTGQVPLDILIANPPQVLLAGRRAPDEPLWVDRLLSHPALRQLAKRIRVETFPEQLTYCGGPVIIPALQALAQGRRAAVEAGRK